MAATSASSAIQEEEYHEILIARKGYCELSPTARVEYATRKGMDVQPFVPPADPVLHQIYREFGDDKFTSRLSRGKLQLIKVPKKYQLSKLEIIYSSDKDCQYVQQTHTIWTVSSSGMGGATDTEQSKDDGPAAKKIKGGSVKSAPMRKVALNTCSGGFKLSEKAVQLYAKLTKTTTEEGMERIRNQLPRDDKLLIAVVEKLGSAASGFCSHIKVAEMPAYVQNWTIKSDEGMEWVAEEHLEWWPDYDQAADAMSE